ncbi:hypothetical protein A5641_28710 [Mycobacterium sp. 1554424.7]|nr:hypothetical protein A5641_28710 [Mycobacterium sp. 1554424.7]
MSSSEGIALVTWVIATPTSALLIGAHLRMMSSLVMVLISSFDTRRCDNAASGAYPVVGIPVG